MCSWLVTVFFKSAHIYFIVDATEIILICFDRCVEKHKTDKTISFLHQWNCLLWLILFV